ncbi:MAG: 16S rRNA (cytosine(967)-C(5))-methyltransferase RsmB [Woeseiaceae bacterium]
MANSKRGAQTRAAAARVVDAVVQHGRSLDAALAEFETGIDEDDRSLLRMLCFGCIRHHWRLQSWLDQLLQKPIRKRDRIVRSLLSVGLFQLSDTRIPDHAAVSQTVEAARLLRQPRYAGLLNACMRRFQREDIATRADHTDETRFDHPEWLLEALAKDWPDDWQAIAEANNDRAPMWLRVNTQHGSVADYAAQLQARDIDATTLAVVPQALQLSKAQPADALPGFADGDVSVQDGGAQLAAPWLLQGISGRVLDACAAPGGKSAHLLELAGSEIDLTCLDIDKTRAASIKEGLDRLGFNATVLSADASKPEEWWDNTPFDAILLDAPCSATGVIRRHPDIKLLRRASDIDRLAALQASIIRALWPLLAPGGRFLYVTCSVLQAENEDIVEAFLGETADAVETQLLPNNNISDVMQRMARGYQILPGTAGLDGFYYACLEKVS